LVKEEEKILQLSEKAQQHITENTGLTREHLESQIQNLNKQSRDKMGDLDVETLRNGDYNDAKNALKDLEKLKKDVEKIQNRKDFLTNSSKTLERDEKANE